MWGTPVSSGMAFGFLTRDCIVRACLVKGLSGGGGGDEAATTRVDSLWGRACARSGPSLASICGWTTVFRGYPKYKMVRCLLNRRSGICSRSYVT